MTAQQIKQAREATASIKAQIDAKKLKHAVSVMRRVDDEGIFEIGANGMSCQSVNTTNTRMGQVTIPSSTFDSYTANEMRIGVDLDKLAGKVLKRASAKDIINISGDADAWQFMRGIHLKTMSLLNPEKLRKMPGRFKLPHTVSIKLPGKTFKEIVAEAADVSDHVLIRASPDALTIEAESNDMNPDMYQCLLPEAQYYERFESDAQCQYATDCLHDIAADMMATDDVCFRFTTDIPCEIMYERDGVDVWFVLAPRIEDK